ncbi:MAG: ArsA family ATPase [Myxococcales bacterium]|nr:MAG: ArsA family ATPase [Myxococcales bacterium]
MSDVLKKRFIIVAGKGGVGRSTLSATLALKAAQEGKKVLVAMCRAKERLSHMLDIAPIGHEITPILPNIDAVNMSPSLSLREYGDLVFRVPVLSRAIFENRMVTGLLRAIPGIEAWSLLGKAFYHATERRSDGRMRYDLVILDAPATGHLLEMLRVPKIILDVAPAGLLRKDAERAWSMFQDSTKSGVVLVTWPEEMPANEAVELKTALDDDIGIKTDALVVNGVLDTIFDESEHELLMKLSTESKSLQALLSAGKRRTLRELEQQRIIAFLDESIDAPLIKLPRFQNPNLKSAQLHELVSHL